MTLTATSSDANTAQSASAAMPARQALLNGIEISLVRTTRPGERMSDGDKLRPGQARRIGLAHLRHWGLDRLMDDAAVLISELVTNAFQHGRGASVGLRLCQTSTHLRFEVSDDTPVVVPALRTPGLLDEGGRGLPIVDAIADAWGVTDDGTRTWCTLLTGSPRNS